MITLNIFDVVLFLIILFLIFFPITESVKKVFLISIFITIFGALIRLFGGFYKKN